MKPVQDEFAFSLIKAHAPNVCNATTRVAAIIINNNNIIQHILLSTILVIHIIGGI